MVRKGEYSEREGGYCEDRVLRVYMMSIMLVLNVRFRYGNSPGRRRVAFLKHLLKCNTLDWLKFHTPDGPTHVETMDQREVKTSRKCRLY